MSSSICPFPPIRFAILFVTRLVKAAVAVDVCITLLRIVGLTVIFGVLLLAVVLNVTALAADAVVVRFAKTAAFVVVRITLREIVGLPFIFGLLLLTADLIVTASVVTRLAKTVAIDAVCATLRECIGVVLARVMLLLLVVFAAIDADAIV